MSNTIAIGDSGNTYRIALHAPATHTDDLFVARLIPPASWRIGDLFAWDLDTPVSPKSHTQTRQRLHRVTFGITALTRATHLYRHDEHVESPWNDNPDAITRQHDRKVKLADLDTPAVKLAFDTQLDMPVTAWLDALEANAQRVYKQRRQNAAHARSQRTESLMPRNAWIHEQAKSGMSALNISKTLVDAGYQPIDKRSVNRILATNQVGHSKSGTP